MKTLATIALFTALSTPAFAEPDESSDLDAFPVVQLQQDLLLDRQLAQCTEQPQAILVRGAACAASVRAPRANTSKSMRSRSRRRSERRRYSSCRAIVNRYVANDDSPRNCDFALTHERNVDCTRTRHETKLRLRAHAREERGLHELVRVERALRFEESVDLAEVPREQRFARALVTCAPRTQQVGIRPFIAHER
jgi:hypothetical protein